MFKCLANNYLRCNEYAQMCTPTYGHIHIGLLTVYRFILIFQEQVN
uniref:Uncharacterized protein n=1 Tax=Anguilla anguilla TaxID=7936 RepID=A0A0E9PGD1_ANGAN